MTIILQCPVCRNPLLNSADGYQCAGSHSFDAAREGYVNLLLAHKKHSKQPGDSKEMLRSRRRFLNLGLYNPISDAINEAAAAHLPGRAAGYPCNILDAGCGEGFYLNRLKDRLSQRPVSAIALEYYGIDISKEAVRLATQRDRTMNWFVASVRDLPFAQTSLDLVLNVFSPAHYHEFSRVLTQSGALVTVSPGPKHLNGLRKIIYADAREHAASTISEEVKGLFSLSSETRVHYPLELKGREAIMDLLAMTPYFWNIDFKTTGRVAALEQLATDVDVEIRVFRK
jgi:23S rRNA (guanine745-N1)-methyltransferase